jgi:hypothetical protein
LAAIVVTERSRIEGSPLPTRIVSPALALALVAALGVLPAHAGTLSAVSPMGASSSVAVGITGTGFNTTAASNVVTFTPASGPPVTAAASAVTTLSAATGLRRLTVAVPAGLPIGTAALRVVNTATGEASAGKSLEIIEIQLPEVASATVGAAGVNVRIAGSANATFAAGTTRAAFGTGITVNSTTVESATSLVANITVSPTAAPGGRSVGVITGTQTVQRPTAFFVVEVPNNRPPVWSNVDPPVVSEGAARDVPLQATDPDGDALTLTAGPLPPFATFLDLGNGTATLALRPGNTHAGTYDLTLTATDAKGASAVLAVRVIVTEANQSPTGNDRQLTVAEDGVVAVTLTGADPDGDPLTFVVEVAPAHGALSGAAPDLLYTPAPDYFGPDSLKFTARDGASSSAMATVDINVTEVNDPPVLGSDTASLRFKATLPGIPPPPPCRTPCGVIYGDPHLLTYDRAPYDVQAVGEVIATKSTTDDFEIQARFTPVPRQRIVSIATAVAMRVAGHRVTFYRTTTGQTVRIDGVQTAITAAPTLLPGGGTIGTYGLRDSVIVVWPDGTTADVSAVGVYPEYYRFVVEVGLAPSRLGHVVGLLGGADGTLDNDLVTRNGAPVAFPNTPFATLYGTYVNSWRINMAESLFDYDTGQTTDTFTDLSFPDQPATPQSLPASALTMATNTCAQFGLTSNAVRDACIVDVGVTGDADFATEAAAAQASGLGIPSNAGKTSIGTSTTVTIDIPGQTAVRTFPAVAGQRVTLSVTGNTIAGGDLTLRDPNGVRVASLFVNSATGFIDAFTLPSAGTYTIVVDPRDQLVGTLTFTMTEVPPNAGSTAIGTPTTVSIATVGEVATRTFSGTAGQKLTLAITGNNIAGMDLTIRDPNGVFVAAQFASGATAFHDVFTLPVTGIYSVTVDPRNQLVGSLTFLLSTVPDNTGTTAIGVPTTVAIGTIGENATRTFSGTAGQKVTLTVTSNSIPGVDLTIRDPSNAFVTAQFASGATAFHDTFTLPVTGTYTITIDPREQLVGTVTFRLDPVPDNPGTAAIGSPFTVSIGTIGENATRTFVGTAGQKLTLAVSANTIAGVDVTIRDASNAFVAAQFASSATAFHDTFTLPVTGTYTMTIDPRDQLVGQITLLLRPVPDNTGTTAIGTPTTVTIGTIGENATRTFAGTAGQMLTLGVTGNTIAGVDITIRDSSNAFVAAQFASSATAFHDTFTLPATGTYTMTIDPRDQLVGAITITLNPVPENTGATAIGTPTPITIGTIGENALRTFTAAAGQSVTLSVSGNTIAQVDLTVRNPSNGTVSALFASGATATSPPFTLPVAGTYTITVDPRGQFVGSLTFTLTGN